MHVARADGSNEPLASPQAKRKRHENRFAFSSPANADEPFFFFIGMRGVRRNPDLTPKKKLDLRNGDAMFLAFLTIAVVPIETGYNISHLGVCVYKCQY